MELTLRQVLQMLPIFLSLSIMMGTFTTWIHTNRKVMNTATENMKVQNIEIHKELANKSFPVIKGNNIRIKKGASFTPSTYISALDIQDGDISNRINIYGEVDTSKKGVYKIKCVVKNSYGLKTTKYIQVLVD